MPNMFSGKLWSDPLTYAIGPVANSVLQGPDQPAKPKQAPGGSVYPQGTKTAPTTPPATQQRRAAIAGGARGTALTRSLTGG